MVKDPCSGGEDYGKSRPPALLLETGQTGQREPTSVVCAVSGLRSGLPTWWFCSFTFGALGGRVRVAVNETLCIDFTDPEPQRLVRGPIGLQLHSGGPAEIHFRDFKFSTDPKAEEKIFDVVGLYLNPPTNAVVLSVDEKTQIQALGRTQPMLPLRPGLPARAATQCNASTS